MKQPWQDVQSKLGVRFVDEELLIQAFTHSSFAKEARANGLDVQDNEVLEFLGDGALRLCVRDYLFKNLTQAEGGMSKRYDDLTNNVSLGATALRLGIFPHLRTQVGWKDASYLTKTYMAAGLVEAIIGALYLDQGLAIASEFVVRCVVPPARSVSDALSCATPNNLLSKYAGGNVTYRGKGGDEQQALIDGKVAGSGKSHDPKVARTKAARAALTQILGRLLSEQKPPHDTVGESVPVATTSPRSTDAARRTATARYLEQSPTFSCLDQGVQRLIVAELSNLT